MFINQSELNLNKFGVLGLNGIYGSLIDWEFEYVAENAIHLIGFGGAGIKDASVNEYPVINGASFKDKILEPRPGGFTSTIDFFSSRYLVNNVNIFAVDTTNIFTYDDAVLISFFTIINGEQQNRKAESFFWADEEVMFHTNRDDSDGMYGDNENGIVVNFYFVDAGNNDAVKFKVSSRIDTNTGKEHKQDFNDWDTKNDVLEYAEVDALEWHNYIFVFTKYDVKVYIDGNLHGKKTYFWDNGQYPTGLYNLKYNCIGGYNQNYGSDVSANTKQFWQSVVADIKIFNKELNTNEISGLQNSTGYTGDMKIFADRLKLSTDFTFDEITKELTLKTTAFDDKVNNIVDALTTDNIDEGVDNLYYTETRFDTSFDEKTTNNLTEGVDNLYYTETRFDTSFDEKTTNILTEGVDNLYYTETRFDTSFDEKTTNKLTEGVDNLFYK